jgi:hypothetical protein
MKPHPIFNDSKYTRWYYAIIQKRAVTDRRRRYETHHILPQSLGGSDEQENLVRLSGHDHAWCHWLLTKMTTGEDRSKMIYAFNMMGVYGEHMERQSSYAVVRAYERNRLEWSKTHSDKMKGREPWNKGLDMKDDPRCKGGKKNKGKKLSPEVAEAKRLRQIGRKRSDETRAKMSVSQTGIPKPKSLEHRMTVSKTMTGKKKPEGHGDKVRLANVGRKIINKNGVEKRVTADELQSYLNDNWLLGRSK